MTTSPMILLKQWFLLERRSLPWRESPSAYQVWISEVMLQQTQVAVVKSYYQRWMHRFPTIQSLAEATKDEVIKVWEGLGYYARARHLHEAAQDLVATHHGKLPSTKEELQKIKGLGPYTVGAILSFAFHQKAAAVDGNVLRLLSRYFCIEEDISHPKTRKKIEHLTETLLGEDPKEPWVVMEALIELGAQVCQRTPKCGICPLEPSCMASKRGCQSQFPIKKAKVTVETLTRQVLIFRYQKEVLVKRGMKGKVMADLYEFPYLESTDANLMKTMGQETLFGLQVEFEQSLPEVVHGFTRFRAHLFPTIWSVEMKKPVEGYEWISWEQVHALPFSSGHRRIIKEIDLLRN